MRKSGGSRRFVGSRVFVSSALASLIFVVPCFVGAASAVTLSKSTPHAHANGLTAADDQYGEQHVVTPVSGVEAAKKSVEAPKESTGSAAPMTPPAATTATSPDQTLPFTGISLLKFALIGLGLVALGLLLRRWPTGSRRDG